MARAKASTTESSNIPVSVDTNTLAAALTAAINAAKPPEKKNIFNRKGQTPWDAREGEVKPKLKRKVSQHGIGLDEDFLTPEQVSLFNKLRPGTYLNGDVTVTRRKDKGINIHYPVKTVAQRMRMVSTHGVRNLTELLERIVSEQGKPKKPEIEDLEID